MARGQFRLLDRDMDDLVRTATIARRIDMRRPRLLPPVNKDPPIGSGPHARGRQRKPRGRGVAAERIQQVIGPSDKGPSLVPERYGDSPAPGIDSHDLGVRQDLDALVLKCPNYDTGRLLRVPAQEIGAPLDHGYPRADPAQELRKLAGDNSST